MKYDYDYKAPELFQRDLQLAKQMGVRDFRSIFISNNSGQQEFVYGVKPYSVYENSIIKLLPHAEKVVYNKSWHSLFTKYSTLATREFAELSELSISESETILNDLAGGAKLLKLAIKNGALWSATNK